MINGNDGGATITVDGGKTWTTRKISRPHSSITLLLTTDFCITSTARSRTTAPSPLRAAPTRGTSGANTGTTLEEVRAVTSYPTREILMLCMPVQGMES